MPFNDVKLEQYFNLDEIIRIYDKEGAEDWDIEKINDVPYISKLGDAIYTIIVYNGAFHAT